VRALDLNEEGERSDHLVHNRADHPGGTKKLSSYGATSGVWWSWATAGLPTL
jgi:hypothetical protein